MFFIWAKIGKSYKKTRINISVFLEVLGKNILVFLDILGKNILVNVIKALFLHPLQHQNNDYGTDIQTQTIRQTS